MELKKYERSPEGNNGWHFDYDFIKKISDMTAISEFSSGMEEVECVLRVLADIEQTESNCAIFDVSVSLLDQIKQITEEEYSTSERIEDIKKLLSNEL